MLGAWVAFQTTPIPGWINAGLAPDLPNPSNLIVFVSDIAHLADSYDSLLGTDFDVEPLSPGDIEKVLADRPRLVIFGPDQDLDRTISLSKHPKVLEYLRRKARVVGMGVPGGLIFDEIGESPLALGQMKGLTSSQVLLQDGLTLPGFPLGQPGPLQVESDDPEIVQQAVPALGSYVIQPENGIARPLDEGDACGSYWSIVQYKNLLFWGFSSDAYRLTPQGKQLFISLVRKMHDLEWRGPQAFSVPPGPHPNQSLDCNSLQDQHHFDLPPWQTVTVTVTPKSGSGLVVTLTDPSGNERTVGPLRTERTLTYPGVSDGADWRLTVATDGRTVDSVATYDYQIDESPNWPLLLRAVTVVLLTFVTVLALVLFIVRWWHDRLHPANTPPTVPPEPTAA